MTVKMPPVDPTAPVHEPPVTLYALQHRTSKRYLGYPDGAPLNWPARAEDLTEVLTEREAWWFRKAAECEVYRQDLAPFADAWTCVSVEREP